MVILTMRAQRYGKGRAANESETKPPHLDKKLSFKTANGRRVPLTDLLGLAVPAKAKPPQPKQTDLPRCAGNTKPSDDWTLPPEPNVGNLKKLETTGKQPRLKKQKRQSRYERLAYPLTCRTKQLEQPNPACRQNPLLFLNLEYTLLNKA